ncbi:D-alanyl-D-alanine carboxypeptidase [Ktedonobacter sp. SOSP1-85]|uniref:D-alanyl-D-alanine carboxypeptidase family protein n=1 Tax=Ktedonobacter sp. SOSP1-85 TaxID=2778367 RepID=UPI00191613F6|nr:D-alanyl-D-alanine carboxypeptidase family protein [Ktedonobacter sp. SOSP1-85]GHO81229.1 D-alanyl-D-alanine carboxypeptidase [Ktedonobacter sp. SOSP1-85]
MGRRILGIILLCLALLIIISIPVALFTPVGGTVTNLFAPPTPTPTPRPVLTVRGTPPAIGSKIAYLVDDDTGNVLVNVKGRERVPMASTTKIMTAILTIDKADLNQVVTIKQDAVDEAKVHNGSNAQLVVGDQIRLKDLLYALMLPSGDDAATAIADSVAGSQTRFVTMMNAYAKQLKLQNTHYINADGLTYEGKDGKPDPNHYTTGEDLVKLTRYAMRNPLFAQIVQLQKYVLPANGVHHAYDWETTDTMLSTYAGLTGVKTGFTGEAGYCLVFSAYSSGHRLVGAVLDAKDEEERFKDASSLLDWAFALPVLPPPAPKQ